MSNITFNRESCKKCMLCGEVCPNKIIIKDKSANKMEIRFDRENLCFKCGQCMAICPQGSILVKGLSYEKDFFELAAQRLYEEEFFNLIYSRRAVRNFKEIQVPKELLEKVVKAITFAPPGFPPVKIELIVIQNPDIIKESLPLMIGVYDSLSKVMKNPFIRMMIKNKVGKQKFKVMQDHLIPLLNARLPELKNGKENTITRDAPAMILLLADKKKEDIKADIYIAATFGLLAAHSIGLGGSIMEIIPPAIENNKKLKKLFCVAENQEVVASIILGYPKYKYQKGIIRKLKNVTWL